MKNKLTWILALILIVLLGTLYFVDMKVRNYKPAQIIPEVHAEEEMEEVKAKSGPAENNGCEPNCFRDEFGVVTCIIFPI